MKSEDDEHMSQMKAYKVCTMCIYRACVMLSDLTAHSIGLEGVTNVKSEDSEHMFPNESIPGTLLSCE